jgi:hypothetical protein
VEADFVTFQDDKVWLHGADGRVFGVAMSSLSQADQEFVRQQVQRKKEQQATTTARVPGRIAYGPGRRLATLASQAVDESSGLACSRRVPGMFWTHNDSGDDARIYLFDLRGRDLGSCRLGDVFAFDFEDMLSFDSGGKSYLLVCDVGNNGRAAAVHVMYLIEEPNIDPERGVGQATLPVVQEVNFYYEDDHRNCEAVGIDPTDKTILLATKEREGDCYVYAMPMPEPDPKMAFVARRIATLKLPPVTAMDVAPDGRRAVLLTYSHAYEFVRGHDEDWAAALSHQPREIIIPERIQGESICYGHDGKTLYLTSEKQPTPLLEIPVADEQ